MVDLVDKIHKLKEIGLSTKEKQKFINVSEVFYVWDVLVVKLDIMETIQIIENYTDDTDLKSITGRVVDVLQTGMADMEEMMIKYNIPLPMRPPAGVNISNGLMYVTDRYIYQTLLESFKVFFPILASGFMESTSPEVRRAFKKHLLLVMEIQEIIVEYGKLKGYLNMPPDFNA